MSKSTFSQVSGFFKQKNEKSEAKTKQQYDEYLLTLRNDNTNADEAAFWLKAILYILTAFVVYLGYNYYLSTFSETMDPIMASIFAISIPIVVEIGKLKLCTKGLRAISLGWIDDGIPKTIYWVFVLTVGAGAYWWSYTISTGGIKEVARQNAEMRTQQDSFHLILATATADVDRRIAEVNKSNDQAGGMKTKRGKIAWSGQSIMMDNASTLSKLQEERKSIVDQTTENYKTTDTKNKVKVSAWSSFIERFGGWGEIGSFLCLLALCAFERILRDENHNQSEGTQPESDQKRHPNMAVSYPTILNGNGHAPKVENTTQQRYYFNRDTPSGNVSPGGPTIVPQTLQPVPQPPQPVPQPAQHGSVGADQVLQLLKSQLQKEVGNFNNQQAKPETVAKRMHGHLETAYQCMKSPDFVPTRGVAATVYGYLVESVFPILNKKGWPYENDKSMCYRILEVIPKEHAPV